ncbi:MAG: glycosyltransferase family 4 protein [Oligoflexia bacterium]|nr:glycosyltransferase family 4 protein [Oligoflexia bacterium]
MTRVLVIHRRYRHRGGEDVFLDSTLLPALRQLQIKFDVMDFASLNPFVRMVDALEVLFMALGIERLRPSFQKVKRVVDSERYSHVIFNNFIPTISLDLPQFCQTKEIKVVSWVHNARLICANGLVFDRKSECFDCWTKGSHRSFFKNCQHGWVQSLLYALIYKNRRVAKRVLPHVDVLAAVSTFSLKMLEKALGALSFKGKSETLYSIAFDRAPQEVMTMGSQADKPYVLYLGRLSYEKGPLKMLEWAQQFREFNFVVAGDGPLRPQFEKATLENLIYVGVADTQKKWNLISGASAIAIPSLVKENAPMVISESQSWGIPVIYSEGGGAEELVGAFKRSGCVASGFNGKLPSAKIGIGIDQLRLEFLSRLTAILDEQ